MHTPLVNHKTLALTHTTKQQTQTTSFHSLSKKASAAACETLYVFTSIHYTRVHGKVASLNVISRCGGGEQQKSPNTRGETWEFCLLKLMLQFKQLVEKQLAS